MIEHQTFQACVQSMLLVLNAFGIKSQTELYHLFTRRQDDSRCLLGLPAHTDKCFKNLASVTLVSILFHSQLWHHSHETLSAGPIKSFALDLTVGCNFYVDLIPHVCDLTRKLLNFSFWLIVFLLWNAVCTTDSLFCERLNKPMKMRLLLIRRTSTRHQTELASISSWLSHLHSTWPFNPIQGTIVTVTSLMKHIMTLIMTWRRDCVRNLSPRPSRSDRVAVNLAGKLQII